MKTKGELQERFETLILHGTNTTMDRNRLFDLFWNEIEAREAEIMKLGDMVTSTGKVLIKRNEKEVLEAKISHLEDANKNLRELLVTAEERGENKARAEVSDNEADGYVFCGKCGKMK